MAEECDLTAPSTIAISSGETEPRVNPDADDASDDDGQVNHALHGAIPNRKLGKTARKKLRQKGGGAKPVKSSLVERHDELQALKLVGEEEGDVRIEYTLDVPDFDGDPSMAEFADIFKRFMPVNHDVSEQDSEGNADAEGTGKDIESEHEGSDGEAGGSGLSNKARKRQLQDMVAALKREVAHPEVVESHDVTAPDPKLLVHLKSYRNTVSVPRHWCHKRRYLQGKRGFVKPPFQLPDFIIQTGITKMRDMDAESTDAKTLKSRTRERARPKMGRIEIDYQVLHDAFFKHQSKPRLCHFGDVYYEGRELEKSHTEAKPGVLSERLRQACGMSDTSPPPWLLAMQRFGPPLSYPQLRIPGLNAPLPPGCAYGSGWGQWGHPPVDEYGQPLYGDPFGAADPALEAAEAAMRGTGAVKQHWGEPRADASSAHGNVYGMGVDDTQPEAEAREGEVEEGGEDSGTASVMPSGAASVAPSIMAGSETPDVLNLRKGERAGEARPAVLYQVLPQQDTGLSTGLLGTKHTYNISGAGAGGLGGVVPTSGGPSTSSGGVDLALAPEELGRVSESDLAKRYEAETARAAAAAKPDREDVSDLLADQDRKSRKRKAGDAEDGARKAKKAAKDFKF